MIYTLWQALHCLASNNNSFQIYVLTVQLMKYLSYFNIK